MGCVELGVLGCLGSGIYWVLLGLFGVIVLMVM